MGNNCVHILISLEVHWNLLGLIIIRQIWCIFFCSKSLVHWWSIHCHCIYLWCSMTEYEPNIKKKKTSDSKENEMEILQVGKHRKLYYFNIWCLKLFYHTSKLLYSVGQFRCVLYKNVSDLIALYLYSILTVLYDMESTGLRSFFLYIALHFDLKWWTCFSNIYFVFLFLLKNRVYVIFKP